MQQIKTSLIAAGIYLLVFGEVVAANFGGPVADGNQLLSLCENAVDWIDEKPLMSPNEKNNAVLCVGYVLGFDAGHSKAVDAQVENVRAFGAKSKSIYCIPGGTTMKNLVLNIVNYLKNNSKQNYKAPDELLAKSLAYSYPCR